MAKKERVFDAIESKSVKFVRLWFTGVLDLPRGLLMLRPDLDTTRAGKDPHLSVRGGWL